MASVTEREVNGRLVRRAVVADVPALVELRAEMFRAMGTADVESSEWRTSAQDWFIGHLDDARVCIVVVEMGSRVVSTSMAVMLGDGPLSQLPERRRHPHQQRVHLARARRQGHGQAAFAAVLEWAHSTGAPRAELMATNGGQAMYEAAGFAVTRYPAMRAPLSTAQRC